MARQVDELLSMSGTAREVGVPESTLRWHARTGKVPCIQDDSGRRHFWRSDLPEIRATLAQARGKQK